MTQHAQQRPVLRTFPVAALLTYSALGVMPELAHRAISLLRSNLVASGVKRRRLGPQHGPPLSAGAAGFISAVA